MCRGITGDKPRGEDRQGKWGYQCPGKPGVHDIPGVAGAGEQWISDHRPG